MGTTDESKPEEAQQENTQKESERIHYLQLNSGLLYETGIKKFFTTPGGDTLMRIYIEAHCASLQNGGVMEIPEWSEAAQYIIDKTTLTDQGLDMVRTAIRYMLRYELIACTRRDGTAVRLTSADIKDINVDDIALIEFLLTEKYTRSWTKDAQDRREKREKKKKEQKEAEEAERLAKADIDRIVTAWNATTLPPVDRMTDGRREHIAARVKSFGVDKIVEAIAIAETRPFLHGKGEKGWVMTFGSFVKNDEKIATLLEGGYVDWTQGQPQQPSILGLVPQRDDLSERGITDKMERHGLIASDGTIRADRWEEIRETSGLSAAMTAAIDAAAGFNK